MLKQIKKTAYSLLPLLAVLLTNDLLTTPEVRKITPPKLDAAYLGEKILCHRPMRRGTPNMTVEQIDDKMVAHNYGHGGSGWSLAPGATTYVNSLLEQVAAEKITKKTSITIIGAGVIGLFTAYDLLNRGYTKITIVARDFDNLTSHHAGGSLGFASMDNTPEFQAIINDISLNAYTFYASIARHEHPHFNGEAVIIPFYMKDRENSGFEQFINKSMQPAKDVILDFGNGATQAMVAYDDSIFIKTAKMMQALTDYIKASGMVTFKQQKISSFSEITDTYIINCTGLGAQTLVDDNKLVSVQGNLITLKNQNPNDLQHMIYLPISNGTTITGLPIDRFFYQAPKQSAHGEINDIGVIGGTFIEGATADTPHEEEFAILLQGAKDFYGIK